MTLSSMMAQPEWRSARVRCTGRVVSSLVRRRIPALAEPVVAFDGGRSKLIADLSTSQGLRLFRYGIQDPELDLIRRLVGRGDAFVDVGSNIGLFSLVAAAQVGPEGQVIACDPVSSVLNRLLTNARLSGFTWVTGRQVAVSDTSGVSQFVVFGGDRSGLSSFAPASPAEGHTETVRTATLDDLVPPDWVPRVSLVKIDAEGAEARVLRGAQALMDQVAPDILIEIEPSHLSRQGTSIEEVQSWANGLGYVAFRVEAQGGGILLRAEGDWQRASRTPNLFLSRRADRLGREGIVVA
jgi:FkbM family methyltransferase